jgi:hypothetical protein
MALQFDNGATILEVAALAALRCRSLHRYSLAPIRTHVERYWQASKTRQGEWQGLLSTIRRYEEEDRPLAGRASRSFAGLIEEIFASDVLTRIWSAVVPQIGKVACPDLMDFMQSALMGQMEVQARVLQLLLEVPQLQGAADRLNKVRCSTERWIDLLLGYLQPCCQIDALACNLSRAHDFASTFRHGSAEQQWAAELLLAQGIADSAARLFRSRCPNPQLNRRVVQSVLDCLGPDLLDAVGPMAGVWQTRLLHATVEMKYWLDKLEVEDCVR